MGCICRAVVPAEYTELGLEERRQRRLLGRAQAGLHRSELFGAGILHADGKSLYDEIVQSGKRACNISNVAAASGFTVAEILATAVP